MYRVALLGTLQVEANQQPVKFVTEAGRVLFAYLVSQQEQRLSRQHLATVLWPVEHRETAAKRLRVTLSRLRRSLTETGAPDIIGSDRSSIWIEPSAEIWLDTTECERYLSLETEGSMQWGMRRIVRWRERATQLYRGEFLADLQLDSVTFQEWVMLERTRWQQRIVRVMEQLAANYLALNRPKKTIQIAQRLLQIEPEREEGHRVLMQAFLQTGRWIDALKQYQLCKKALAEMWGIAPHPTTMRLFALAQAGQAGKYVAPQNGMVRQAGQLPALKMDSIGRDLQTKQLTRLLLDDVERFITLVGVGGVGKSHLALSVAHAVQSYFPDGAWFLPLDTVDVTNDAPELIAQLIAQRLQLSLNGHEPVVQQLCRTLGERELLLIFDNFEHLLHGGKLIADLLQAAPRCAFLCTSREPLRFQAEYVLRLEGLLAQRAQQLFEARAQRLGVSLSADDAPHVAQICRLVEGNPLGIELAAAQMRQRDVAAVVALVADALADLNAHLRDVPTRHRSLQATFDVSWQLLNSAERTLLTRLALFRGAFDAAAAHAITGATRHDLAALCDKSLVQRRGGDWFGLHALIREFAAAQLTDKTATADAHSHYYLAQIAQHAAPLRGATPQESVAQIDPIIDNVLLGWETAVTHEQHDRLRLATDGLSQYLQIRRPAREGVRIFGRLCAQLAPSPLLARVSVAHARFLIRANDYAKAISAIETALGCESADAWSRAMAHILWGEALWRQAQYTAATTQLNIANTLASDLPRVRAWYHHHSGIVCDMRGDSEQAQHHLTQAIAIWRTVSDRRGEAASQNSLGMTQMTQRQFAAAHDTMQQAYHAYREMQDYFGQTIVLTNLGYVALSQQQHQSAETFLLQAHDFARQIGYTRGECTILHNLGANALELGQLREANEWLSEALRVAKRVSAMRKEAEILRDIGRLRQLEADNTAARHLLDQALDLARQTENVPTIESIEAAAAGLSAD